MTVKPTSNAPADSGQSPEEKAGAVLQEQLSALSDRLFDVLGTLKQMRKAAEGLTRPGAIDSPRVFGKLVEQLERADLDFSDLVGRRSNVLSPLKDRLSAHRRRIRMKTMAALSAAAGEAGLSMERLGDSPPTCLLRPVTVVLDFEAGQTDICYARQTVLTVGLHADEIIAGRTQAMADIKAQAVNSVTFFDRVSQAYTLARGARGLAAGERIDLVDLLAPLALLGLEPASWRKLKTGQPAPYPRYLLAYQMRRLRKDGLLQRNGWRIDLGTATGGSTRNKTNVLYIPTNDTEGQYYLSLRVIGA